MSLIYWNTARTEVSSVAVERPTVFGAFPLSNLAEAFTLSGSVEERVMCGIRAVLHIANAESNPIAYPLYQRVDTGLVIINLDGCELVAINSSPDTILDCQITEIPLSAFICKNHGCPPKCCLKSSSCDSQLTPFANLCSGIAIDPLSYHHCFSNNESLTQLRRCSWNFILARVQHIPPHIRNFLRADLATEAAMSLPSLENTHSVQ